MIARDDVAQQIVAFCDSAICFFYVSASCSVLAIPLLAGPRESFAAAI